MSFFTRKSESGDDVFWYRSWLNYGEQVLWQGKPEKFSLLEKQDWFMIPFSIMWCGFAVFWEATVIMANAPLMFKIWGIPFVCLGLYLVAGRFIHKRHVLRNTDYVITNRKIIRRAVGKIDFLERTSLPAMQVESRDDGSGTIRFQVVGRRGFSGFSTDTAGFSLVGLRNVRQVFDVIETMCQD